MSIILNIIDKLSDEELHNLSVMSSEDAEDYFESLEADRCIEEYKNNPNLM